MLRVGQFVRRRVTSAASACMVITVVLAVPTVSYGATQGQTDRELQARHDAIVRDARRQSSQEARGAANASADALRDNAQRGASSTAGRAGSNLSDQWNRATREANRPHPFDGSHTRLFALLLGLVWLAFDARLWLRRRRRTGIAR